MPLPTFVILGAQKCGTTTLAATLRTHPEVHFSSPKELHYFDRPMGRGLDWYADQFSPKPHHRAWGEATPSYIFRSAARRRCAKALPDARFVVLLRDPAKRAHSHYWHNRRFGVETAASFEEAIGLEPTRTVDTVLAKVRYSYLARGRYIEQLRAMEELVGRERLHVGLLEDLTSDREAMLAEAFEFIGVDPAWASEAPPPAQGAQERPRGRSGCL